MNKGHRGGSNKWRKAKDKVYIRQEGFCLLCDPGTQEIMVTHHIYPVSMMPDLYLEQENLVGVCPKHHGELEMMEPAQQMYLVNKLREARGIK